MLWKRKQLPRFHPATMLRDWSGASPGSGYSIADAVAGAFVTGATGSGKTSGPAHHLAVAYLAHGFSGLVLCSKSEECGQWLRWAAEAERSKDIIIFDASGRWRFNFLDCEAARDGAGAGLTINMVALLNEIASALAAGIDGEGGGDNKWFRDALDNLNTNLIDLPLLAGLPVSMDLLNSIVNSAPQTLAEANSKEWQRTSVCAAILREAEARTENGGADMRAHFDVCRTYWTEGFAKLSERTRSIVTLSFSMLVRPLLTRPLGSLFSSDTNITPEAAFETGKIIIVNLPVQEFRLVGRVANLLWKHCWQVAVLRRVPPSNGSFLRPSFIWMDEYQNFCTPFDAEYQAVARSAGGCTVALVQNRESLIRVLGKEATVDSFLGNLQTKFFCQNSGETNEWASKLLGERWMMTTGVNLGRSSSHVPGYEPSLTGGVNRHEQHRRYLDPSRFTTLRRGGPAYDHLVDCVVYKGGFLFASPDGKEKLPYALLAFKQS